MPQKLKFQSCYEPKGCFCLECDEMLWKTVGMILVVAETASFYVSKAAPEGCPLCGSVQIAPMPEQFSSAEELESRIKFLSQMSVEQVLSEVPLIRADSVFVGSLN